jgi:hypothetical protein
MIRDNSHYGHGRILREYCGVRLPLPIPGRIQHGWTPHHGLPERTWSEPWPKYVWSRRNLACWERDGLAGAIAIGAPFLYLPPPPAADPPERSLLLVPFHGWEKDRLHGSLVAYADSVAELERQGFGPITVCLYWTEFEDAACRRIFEDRGWRVITNGHREHSPDFLHRQRRAILEHAYVSSNRVASAGFYALHCGRRFFLHGPSMGLSQGDDPAGERFAAWQAKEFPELGFERFGDQSHRAIGERELGLEFLRSPDRLRDEFLWRASRCPGLVRRVIRRQLVRMGRRGVLRAARS